MDHFGIGAAIARAVRIYLQSARQTGRTTSMVEDLHNGDRIVFANAQEARRVERLIHEVHRHGSVPDVDCTVIDPREPEKIFERSTSQGRTIFDHTWVEMFYQLAIERATKQLDHLTEQSSGYGEAHRETARAYREIAKWRR